VLLPLLAWAHALLYATITLWIVVHISSVAHLLWLRARHPPPPLPAPLSGDDLPVVTVQLPLYNEAPNVEGLLDAVAALDWPAERLEIQVLDDSTDETVARVAEKVTALQAAGVDARHVRRQGRAGFKAGALDHGLETARGTLVAIFDADFRPRPDFLRRAAAALGPEIGLVQARWSFINPGASVLTRAQALHLDGHFGLEQQARSDGGLLMGFNGTAGLWRREAISAGGGWEGDTLTEDLDLSYRVQLAGWRLRYLDALAVDNELPETIQAIRSQQHRWIRGGAQVARKLLRRLWAADQPLRRKLQGTAHLMASTVFLPVLAMCLLSPALPLLAPSAPAVPQLILGVCGVLLRGVLGVLVLVFGAVCTIRSGSLLMGLRRLVWDFPAYFALATAICVHNAEAAWAGWRGPTGTFVRTPKRGHTRRPGAPRGGELLLMGWSWLGLGVAYLTDQTGLVVFLMLQAVAFTAWVGLSASRP